MSKLLAHIGSWLLTNASAYQARHNAKRHGHPVQTKADWKIIKRAIRRKTYHSVRHELGQGAIPGWARPR